MLRVRLHNQLHLDSNQTEKSWTVKGKSLEFKPIKKKNINDPTETIVYYNNSYGAYTCFKARVMAKTAPFPSSGG